jgi:hypothetical protein
MIKVEYRSCLYHAIFLCEFRLRSTIARVAATAAIFAFFMACCIGLVYGSCILSFRTYVFTPDNVKFARLEPAHSYIFLWACSIFFDHTAQSALSPPQGRRLT